MPTYDDFDPARLDAKLGLMPAGGRWWGAGGHDYVVLNPNTKERPMKKVTVSINVTERAVGGLVTVRVPDITVDVQAKDIDKDTLEDLLTRVSSCASVIAQALAIESPRRPQAVEKS